MYFQYLTVNYIIKIDIYFAHNSVTYIYNNLDFTNIKDRARDLLETNLALA